jgi:hypothetical protein
MPAAFHFPLAFALLTSASVAYPAAVASQDAGFGELPMHFEANRGQADPSVRFTAQGAGYSVYLSSREAVLMLDRQADAREDSGESVAMRLRLVGSRVNPDMAGVEELPGNANGPTYEKVRYSEVYPGIDLVYYGNQQQLEFDFIVAPGADTRRIALDFTGADKLEIDASGDLLLSTAAGTVRQHKPIAWQESGGVRREIGSRYVGRVANRVGLELDEYDRSLPLVIDQVRRILSSALPLASSSTSLSR